MRKLAADFSFEGQAIEEKLVGVSNQLLERAPDASEIRRNIESGGFEVKTAEPKPPNKASFLAADSSFAKKELRFNVLWGVHAVCVHAVYDGGAHADSMMGQGTVSYGSLAYDSRTDFGVLKPYTNVDERLDAIRVGLEARVLNDASEELGGVDYILFDGSLTTPQLNDSVSEAREAKTELSKLESKNLIGLVEDSHETDISRQLGYEYTNALIFNVALKPLEYVVQEKNGFDVCYLKLPGKKLPHLGGAESRPTIARWEFKRGKSKKQLPLVAGVWLTEDDIHHPQTYPVRLSDHLTRKIKLGRILDAFSAGENLAPQFRSMRQT